MEKTNLRYIVDLGLAVFFIGVAVTGIMKWSPVRSALGLVWGTPLMTNISLIHDYSGIAMTLLVLVHLFLNRKWIICETKNLFKNKK